MDELTKEEKKALGKPFCYDCRWWHNKDEQHKIFTW